MDLARVELHAHTLMNRKDYRSAYDLLLQYLNVCVDEALRSRFLATMGYAQYWSREERAAKRLFRDAIAVDATNMAARLGLAKVLFTDKKFNAAANEYRYVLRCEPQHEGALKGLQKISAKIGPKAALRHGLPAP